MTTAATYPAHFEEQVRRALGEWHKPDDPAAPLSNTLSVQQLLVEQGNHRRAINHLLQQAIHALGEDDPKGADLLTRHYIKEQTAVQIAAQLNVVEQTVFKVQREKIKQVAAWLWRREEHLCQEKLTTIGDRLERPTYSQLFGVAEHLDQLVTLLNTPTAPWLVACNWQKAQAYHEQALAIFEQANDQRRIAWSLQNLAVALQEQADYEKALVLYQRAATILERNGDEYHLAIIQMNLGRTYYQSGQPTAGLVQLTKAANYFHHVGDQLNIARVETNLGICHHTLQTYPAAEQAFLAAIKAYSNLDDHAWRLNAVAGLGMVYVADRQYGKAIQVLEQALAEMDQIKNHPYYASILNYLHQYLAAARPGQGDDKETVT